MAENKKSFVLYCDLLKSIDHLTYEEKGILFTHLLEYVNDKNPVLTDRLILTAWKPIELQLKRDLQEWEVIKEDRSQSGVLGNLKRWHSDLYNKVLNNEINVKDAEIIAKCRKVSHSDKNNRTPSQPIANIAVNVTDNVNVTDTVSNILLEKELKKSLKNDIDFAFCENSELKPILIRWLEYKKWKGQRYKGQDSVETMFKKLCEYSNNDPTMATEIIEDAIAKNYTGFFKPTKITQNGNTKTQSRTNDTTGGIANSALAEFLGVSHSELSRISNPSSE